ncbi:MAG TPA: phage tail family protein [Companilactobacillus farciminis]|uniref:Phage tail family protein n=1 Tax=Companilactobacillus farciminis TaxID=1612 RepID=A0A921LB48_9LACO|nr:phage tail family protein [Companilactobacillus farciminis]
MTLHMVIDGVYDSDMLLAVEDRPALSNPNYEFESDYVDGRNGSLSRLKYIKDVTQKVKFNMLEDFNVKEKLRHIKSWLFNCKKIRFDDDIVYRKVKYVEIGDIDNEIAEYGSFEVSFVCDPFEYHVGNDEVTIVKDGIIFNRGTIYSLPKLEIMGSGEGVVTINDQAIELNLTVEHAYIDSEIQEIYKDDTNLGLSMVGDFPRLKPGQNDIEISGDFDTVKFNVRERYL